MILLLRLFAPAAGPEDAATIGHRLLDALHDFSPATVQPPERYWKIPEWFEHTLRLSPASAAGFDRLLALAPAGWEPIIRDGECSAVWDAAPGTTFLLPEVTWAELLLIHPPSGTSAPPFG